MFGFRRRGNKERERQEKYIYDKQNPAINVPVIEYQDNPVCERIQLNEPSFSEHMSKYTGETVTIFVSAGGAAGSGFTGILAAVNENYVRLITRIGPPPACSLGNGCRYVAFGSYNFYSNLYRNKYRLENRIVSLLGSVTYIPVSKIVSFVHNTV